VERLTDRPLGCPPRLLIKSTRYRLSGSREQLKDHLNHLVGVAGKPHGEDISKAIAGNGEATFDVTGIQDLAPTCSASHAR
jgi:hypothetical protein